MPPTPPIVVDLVWTGGLQFGASFRDSAIIFDSAGASGPSPVEAVGGALGACMGMDLVHILTKGRHQFRAVRGRLVGGRAPGEPKRLLAVALHFTVEGNVPAEAVERAITLSREKYCSVWQSMRQDIDLKVTFDITS